MKNRKLFAIITLVAFMLTMMPMMAFATTASGSSISVDDATAKANGTDALEFILDIDEKYSNDTQRIYIFAERSGSLSDADTITIDGADSYIESGAGYVVIGKGCGVGTGENTVKVTSDDSGTVTLKAYVVDGVTTETVAQVYNGSDSIIKKALVGSGCTGKFTATSSTITADVTITDKEGGTVKAVKGEYTGASANNGVDYYKVSLKFKEGDSKLVGEDVTFSVDKNGATLSKDEETTSATGKVDFKVSASKPGTYTVTVDCGSYSEEFVFVFDAAVITKVKVVKVVDGTIAVDNPEKKAIELVAYDANGNVVSSDKSVEAALNALFTIECTAAPEDSSYEDVDDEWEFVYDINETENIFITFEPDAEGSYSFKIYNNNTGVADYATINAAEFGTISHATISYPSGTFALGEQTQAANVKIVDKNGVKKSPSSKTFSYSGVGVADFNKANGQITFKNDNDYVGNEIVVSVVANNKYAASTTLVIGAEAAALNFGTVDAEVGETAVVNAKVVDVNGNATAVAASTNYDVTVQSAIIIEKPAGATASVDADYFEDAAATFLKKGTGKVEITSDKEGIVKANVVLALTNNKPVTIDGKDYDEDEYTFYLSGVATANFGEVTAVDNGETSTITFIIGSNTFVANGTAAVAPVAPNVVDGRTLVPVRAFAEATGAEVVYDAATSVITITAEGLVAQMTVGSNIMTVNGETVVMDSAATVVNGSTVLPVRYAGQALGYDFEVAYGNDGAATSVTMFK